MEDNERLPEDSERSAGDGQDFSGGDEQGVLRDEAAHVEDEEDSTSAEVGSSASSGSGGGSAPDVLEQVSDNLADSLEDYNDGIALLATTTEVQLSQILTAISTISGHVGGGLGSSSASNRVNWSYAGAKFFTGAGGVAYNVALLGAILSNTYEKVSDLVTPVNSISSLSSLIRSDVSELLKLSEAQWGFGYGGTSVILSGSPASYLKKISDRLSSVPENQLNIRASVQSFREEFAEVFGEWNG
ncbi:MAG: hypothetical protein UCH28_05480, partial [Adlercreutzia sp.]|nr:hypothetical protein [Adlercreutzia sp.]